MWTGFSTDLNPKIVRRPVRITRLEAPARNEIGESVVVVITAVLHFHQAPDLDRRCTPELSADQDDGLLQQTACFQILQQRSNRPIAEIGEVTVHHDVVVVVPGLEIPVVHLHHTDAALTQPARNQAAAGEVAVPVARTDVFPAPA